MKINKSTKQWVEFNLRKCKMVNWDRFTPVALGKGIGVYGWIEREKDSYKDFAYVEFDLEKHEIPYFISSSAKYSEQLGEILVKGKMEHNVCTRVEDVFEIKNSIKLKGESNK